MKRLLALFRNRSMDRRMEEEFEHHIEMLAAQHMEAGHTPEEARRLARRDFGSPALHKEAHRDQRSLPWVGDLLMDLRQAARQLHKAPAYCAIAILTMALGIGANSAIFTLVHAALLREAPYPEPERLKDITMRIRGQLQYPVVDSRRFVEFRDHASTFAYVAAMRDKGRINWKRKDSAVEVRVMRVSAEYFKALGIEPQQGRSFTREEESSGNSGVAILSSQFAQIAAEQGSRQTLDLGGSAHSVVGVLPPTFPEKDIDVYLPMHVRPIKDGENTMIFGRLKEGTSPAAAAAQCTQLLQALLVKEYNRSSPEMFSITMERFGSAEGREFQQPLFLLSGVVALILLIACANLANLMLARATVKARELAIRASLGAGRFRLARQMLAESTLLSTLGAVAGLIFAEAFLRLLIAASPIEIEELWTLKIDLTVFAFAFGVALVSGLLFGLIPAWSTSRIHPIEAIRDGGTKASSGKSGGAVRRTLVIAEVALSVVLLAISGLVIRSLLDLLAIPSGADEAHVLAARMSLRGDRYDTSEEAGQLFDKGLELLRGLPGVASASVTLALPLERGLNCSVLVPDSPTQPEARKFMNWRYTSANHLADMHVPLLAGRYMLDTDRRNAAPIAIINESFVKRYLPGMNVIGRTVVENCGGKTSRTIVGVVADLKTNSLRERVPPTMYIPIDQASDDIIKAAHTWFPMNWVLRTKAEGPEMNENIRQVLHSVDPGQPVQKFITMDSLRQGAVRNERFLVYLMTAFAALALALSAAGVYGVMSFLVTQRRMEFAIRLALGAKASLLAWAVLRQGLKLVTIGLVIGGTVAYVLLTWLCSQFPSLLPPSAAKSVTVFLLPVLSLLITAVTACLAPMWRTTRLDPNEALRSS
jgi:putative ABC transport system permease protein